MTLSKYKDYQELFDKAVLWWNGADQTITGFPIIPAGVTPTPNGTWSNDLDLGNNKILKTFNGSTNYISLTDNDAWNLYDADFTIHFWVKFNVVNTSLCIYGQLYNNDNRCHVYWYSPLNHLCIIMRSATTYTGSYIIVFTPTVSTWYHVTIMRSGSLCLMYINGIPQTVIVDVAFNGTTNIAAPLLIGSYDTSSGFMNGNIKDLIIFKERALSTSEVITLMRLTEPGKNDIYPLIPGNRGVE